MNDGGDDDVMTPSTTATSSSDHHNGNGAHSMTSLQRQISSRQLEATVETEVCCGCRPKQRRYRKRKTKLKSSTTELTTHRRISFAKLFRRKHGYFDADMGLESEWRALERHVQYDDHSDASQFFFDAVDQPLGDEEYPIDGYVIKSGGDLGDYPIIFTTSLQHPAPQFTTNDPSTWLRKSLKISTSNDAAGPVEEEEDGTAEMEEADDEIQELSKQHPKKKTKTNNSKHTVRRDSHISTASRDTIKSHKEPSMRFLNIKQRTPSIHKIHLEQPRVKSQGLKGYPGELTLEEMEECQKFLRGLEDLPSEVSEQVYSFRDIEEEPYTICRWLRATKFDADKILERLAQNQAMFDNAKMDEFYPNVTDWIGAPLSVFLSQYPFLPVGRGKNGCPVNYFLAGKINPEGILCLTTIKKLECYFWYSFMWKFKNEIRAAQERDPDFVRVEGINVIELDGLSSSALSSETMEVIKMASKISDFFPETLHCMLVLNAPGFFAMAWGLIKKFIDPRTAARIQLFANKDKGMKALEKLIDKSQLPLDYDGGNISLSEAFLKESHDPSLIRQEIELVHCKRKGQSHARTWTLERIESMQITVYTRSVSTGHVSIQVNGQDTQSFDAKCLVKGEGDPASHEEFDEDAGTPLPSQNFAQTVVGPGKITVEISDRDDAEKRHSGKSKGYFLVVGDVKQVEQVKPKTKLQNQQKMTMTMAGLSSTSSNEGTPKKARLY
ncbi:CRAL/TRIO domain containing protein [Nitzschia inconspicua]|uniref:CRAL/TRIO domain containing protein n=1 Tax=Nitzschia inconspicua TaxID=303405 RepID=A0A9K3LWR4_9STRA|nr:CRAL/TRIO domain containing protein [Nitzschia inconspicua]